MKIKVLFLFILITFFSTLLHASTLQKTTLQLAWKHQWQFAGYYMAKEKGFYKDVGFDVDIKEFDTGVHITSDVESGKVDFGIGRSSLIYDRSEGKKVVMLASILQHSPIILLSKKREDLQKVTDLKNKKIMLTEDQIGMASINAMLFSHGIQQGMFEFQEHSFNVQDLINDKTDVLLSYISNEPYIMEKQNIPYTIFSPREYNFDFLSDILFTSETLLNKNPIMVKNFRKASLKGWKYAIENPNETTKLILQKYNSQNKSLDALEFEAKKIIELTDYGKIPLGKIEEKRINYITQVYRLMGLITKNFSTEKLIYKVKKDIYSQLTKEEEKWLKKNSRIVMGGEMDWPPFDYVDDTGTYQGIIKNYLELFKEKSGINFEVKTGMSWKELVEALKNKEIDFLPALYSITKEREEFGIFTKPYLKVKNVMFIREDEKRITNLKDIKNHRVAVIQGYATVDSYKPFLDNAKIVSVDSLKDAIYAVLNNKADLFMDSQLVVEYLMNKNLISGIKPVFIPSHSNESQLHMLIRKDQPILHSIIQKLLSSITTEEERQMLDRWVFSKTLNFTQEEKTWLEKGIEVKYVFDPDWKPMEFSNELGEHQGIIKDIITLVEQKTGILFKPVAVEKWSDVFNLVKNREVDMYSGVGETENRKKLMDFTQNNILTVPYVYISRLQEDYIEGLDLTKEKRIAVAKNSTIEAKLSEIAPNIKLNLIDSYDEGFELLLDEKIDFFIVNSALAKYYLNNGYSSQLKITGKPNIDLNLKIGIRNDWSPEALSIINKALEEITVKELDDIIYKWTEVKIQERVDWNLLLKILAGVILIISAILYWNRTMAQEIEKRKQAEKKISLANKEIKLSHKKISDSIQYASLIQNALLPDKNKLRDFFIDSFIIWEPKDVVGGDIFLFETLRNENESLIMIIDCTGHGVPGAFVTMLVKAIERQVIAKINNDKNIEVSPAWILKYFNKTMKKLLKQESEDSISNAGFDGGVLYYNKKENYIKYSGAETPLFYIQNNELNILKSNRHSIGYKKSDINYQFDDYRLDISEETKIYISTDGYLDQNGGEKGFPFGKKRFKELISNNHSLEFEKQKEILLSNMEEYMGSEERNDDITVVGLKVIPRRDNI